MDCSGTVRVRDFYVLHLHHTILGLQSVTSSTESLISAPPCVPEIFVRGINKKATRESIIHHFSSFLPPLCVPSLRWTDTPKSQRTGHCWVTYSKFDHATEAVRLLHHSDLLGTTVSVTLESKIDQDFFFPVAHQQTSIIQRRVRIANESETSNRIKKQKKASSVSYSRNGIMVNGTEFPTPQGIYIRKLLETRHTCKNDKIPLFNVVLDNKFGTNHTKELSESMAMVNALAKLGSMTETSWTDNASFRTRVFVLGDGKVPFTAATMAIYMPSSWTYVSIDPIMHFDVSGELGELYSSIIDVHAMKSEEYVISDDAKSNEDSECSLPLRSVVVVCHSHAPLQEFWDRLSSPKYCIAMPCCKAEWSSLDMTPLCTYDDFEVFSPKRRIHLYHCR